MWLLPASVLAIAAVLKFIDGHFADELFRSGMFTQHVAPLVAFAIIGGEMATALLLCTTRLRRIGWLLVTGFCTAFAVLHSFAVFLGEIVACHCAGVVLSENARLEHVALLLLNLCLLAVSVHALRKRPWARESLQPALT